MRVAAAVLVLLALSAGQAKAQTFSELGVPVSAPKFRPATQSLPALEQAPGADRSCGLPEGTTFPGYLGRTVVAPNAADTAEVTRGYMADGSDMGVTPGTGVKECAWTPPNASDCVRAEVVVNPAATPKIVAGSVPESLRTLPTADHNTMLFVVNPRGTAATRYVFGYGDFNARGVYLHSGASGFTACWNGAGAQVCASGPNNEARDEWSVVAIRKSGTTYTVFVNGVAGTPATNALALVAPTTADVLYLGAAYNGTTPLNGPFVTWYPFSGALSDADIQRFSAQVMCSFASTPNGQSNITDTRPSPAFEVGQAELENLWPYAQNFDNTAGWSGGAVVSVTPMPNEPGPDGGTGSVYAACAVSSGGGVALINAAAAQVTANGGTYTQAYWIKSYDGGTQTFAHGMFDTTAVAFATGATVINSSATAAWQQFSRTATSTTSGNLLRQYVYPDTTTSDGTGCILITAAQMQTGSVVGPYARTFADRRFGGSFLFPHGDNARWATSKGIAGYGGATNIIVRSETLESASWSKDCANITVSADSASCPLSRTRQRTLDLIDNTDAACTAFTGIYRFGTVSSSTGPFVVGFDLATTGGTANKTIAGICSGSNAATCSCYREDGAACTAAMSGTGCRATTSVSSSPVRVFASFTCAAATTSVAAYVLPGEYSVSKATVCAGLAQGETGSIGSPYIATEGTAASRAADKHLFPAPVGPSLTEGCAKVCITPSWTGVNPFGASIFHVGVNTGNTSRIGYTINASDTFSALGGGANPAVAAGFTSGVTKCYVTDWSVAAGTLRVTNITSGATSSNGGFTGFDSFNADLALGSTTAGTNNGNASYSGTKFGSGPGQCN